MLRRCWLSLRTSHTTSRASLLASFLSSAVSSASLSLAVVRVPFVGVPFSATRFFFFFLFSPLLPPAAPLLLALPILVGVLRPLLVLLMLTMRAGWSTCTRRPLVGCSVEAAGCGCQGLACSTGVTGEYWAVELMLCGSYSSSPTSTAGNSRVVERLRVGRVTRGVAAGTAWGSFSTGLWVDER